MGSHHHRHARQLVLPVAPGRGHLGFVQPVFGYFPPTYANQPARSREPPRVAVDVPRAGQSEPVTLPLVPRSELSAVDSVCPYCGVGCATTYYTKDDTIVFGEGRDGERKGDRETDPFRATSHGTCPFPRASRRTNTHPLTLSHRRRGA